MKKINKKDKQRIINSGLFDPDWYSGEYPDVGISGMDPLEHYIQIGIHMRRSPHPLFDAAWYLEQNPDVAEAGHNPLEHYLKNGWKEGRNPHLLFDAAWYLAENPDVAEAGHEPLGHYLKHGWKEGRNPSPKFDTSLYLFTYEDIVAKEMNPLLHFARFGASEGLQPIPEVDVEGQPIPVPYKLSNAPLISILIINYNGLHHLVDLLPSLENQTYTNHEIIVVDNNSSDRSISYLKDSFPEVNLIELERNEGFAEGCNIGFEESKGELVALINNDTVVDSNWLEFLVEGLRSNPNAAAATSKVLFLKPFFEVEIEATHNAFQLSGITNILEDFEYPKLICNKGQRKEDVVYSDGNVIRIKLPNEGHLITLNIQGEERDSYKIKVNSKTVESTTKCLKHKIQLNPSCFTDGEDARYVINNAGSVEINGINPADRGIYEFDSGQYDNQEEVPLFCGCSVLLRRQAVGNNTLFIGKFFAYYEDSELSIRLRKQNRSILYVPKSVVYHKHASTSNENSPRFRHFVERNSTIYKEIVCDNGLNHFVEEKINELNHLRNYYLSEDTSTAEDVQFAEQIPAVITELTDLSKGIANGTLYNSPNKKPRIGIFNLYWNTFGGGEHHALKFAQYLGRHGYVDLISESDFSMSALSDRFSVDLSKCRKRLENIVTSELTRDYDIFINSTFMSSLVSHAPASFFIVSFPHQGAPEDFLASYHFLANSQFTNHWIEEYWGRSTKEVSIVCPSIPEPKYSAENKERRILNVGRFNNLGHDKKQDEIIKTFKQMVDQHPVSENWKLTLLGSVDTSNANERNHFQYLKELSKGYSIEIIANVSHAELLQTYAKSAIYCHATGFGLEPNLHPEKMEHFGITTAEAISYGCIPVVINAGGQPELVKGDISGKLFAYADRDQWIGKTIEIINMYETNIGAFTRMSQNTIQHAQSYFDQAQIRRFEDIFSSNEGCL